MRLAALFDDAEQQEQQEQQQQQQQQEQLLPAFCTTRYPVPDGPT